MVWIELIGCVAGVLTSFAFFPQIMKLLRFKQSQGISVGMYACTLLGCSLWLIYGVFIGSISLILFNLLNILTTFFILILSKRYSS